ncbi:uncharacterized protein LOC104884193 [Beta vulgaris subsp. vulgaris]|uniref:uncharacterized protein LOC104884193 n=1 Tax=Beta vulgaris subsp. vulgaris TaxID=3555 RepID=UPI0020376610|nr:uncharacterized protein LOC104884193 [Beta vulgaris subsp. vulgaris]
MLFNSPAPFCFVALGSALLHPVFPLHNFERCVRPNFLQFTDNLEFHACCQFAGLLAPRRRSYRRTSNWRRNKGVGVMIFDQEDIYKDNEVVFMCLRNPTIQTIEE